MRKGRFVVGIACCLVGVLILLLGKSDGTTAGAAAFGVLGIIMIAVSRGKKG
jgi:hypothetical protein